MSRAAQRFETINDLYRRATGHMRPGKDAAAASGEDPSSDENRTRFEQWLASRAFTEALDRIADLERRLDGVLDGNLSSGISPDDLD